MKYMLLCYSDEKCLCRRRARAVHGGVHGVDARTPSRGQVSGSPPRCTRSRPRPAFASAKESAR